MSLTVLSVAFPFAPVRDDAAGGAEQVLRLLDSGLTRQGHRSIVVASRGSRVEGELVPTPARRGPIDDAARRSAWGAHRAAIARVLVRERVDLVHVHGLDYHAYLPRPRVPVLATLHLPPSFYPLAALRPRRPRTYLQCVSRAQLAACPESPNLVGVIPNGVQVVTPAPAPGPRTWVAAVGRICPEKGFHLALDAARIAGCECRLAGRLFPYAAHQRYFEREVRPRLDARRRFVGPVGPEAKARLLSGARCVLVPSLVDETSSLVAMEALACGTPVVAFARGALPEIVDHGRTGFLVSSVQEMADAIRRTDQIQGRLCRETACRRFSAQAMVERYLGLYRKILDDAPAAASPRTPAALGGDAWTP